MSFCTSRRNAVRPTIPSLSRQQARPPAIPRRLRSVFIGFPRPPTPDPEDVASPQHARAACHGVIGILRGKWAA